MCSLLDQDTGKIWAHRPGWRAACTEEPTWSLGMGAWQERPFCRH